MTPIQKVLLVFSVIAVIASLLEGLVMSLRRPFSYDWKATGASLLVGAGRSATNLAPIAIALPGGAWLYEHRLFNLGTDSWWGVILLFFSLEFCYYWFHRASHRVRWFWATHSVHHTPNQLNLSAAYRLGWTSRLSLALVFFTPLTLLGYAPQEILYAFSLNLLYQFWIHTTWVPSLGPLELIFNTPSAHRVHHAANVEYLDANYGGVLIVFDRLFGTYIPERADLPCRYGLVKPMTSNNPLTIAFHHWLLIWADMRRVRNLRAAVGYLLGPPGWAPDGPGNTTAAIRARAREEKQSETRQSRARSMQTV